MSIDNKSTRFLPAERSSKEDILRKSRELLKAPLLKSIVDGMPIVVLMLDENRQIVLTNKAVASIFHSPDLDKVFGMRPGELLQCAHAFESEGGCGTTEFCTVCGAANAIHSSQQGIPDVKDCRINRTDGEALDLRVWASRFKVGDEDYTFFSLMDITDEKRRRWLERIFFHDIMNAMSGIYAAAEITPEAPPEVKDELCAIILSASQRAIDEINAQRDLTAAESGDLLAKFTPLKSVDLLQELVRQYEKRELAKEKRIEIAPDSENVIFNSDRRLLLRVLENMVKNALEASSPGQTVTLKSAHVGANIRFSIHNPAVMPDAVRLQVFQRSFSTKSNDRGLGTYSMKLITGRYLKGKVSFTTGEEQGTTFFAEYPVNPG